MSSTHADRMGRHCVRSAAVSTRCVIRVRLQCHPTRAGKLCPNDHSFRAHHAHKRPYEEFYHRNTLLFRSDIYLNMRLYSTNCTKYITTISYDKKGRS